MNQSRLVFFVPGIPQPGGSKKAFVIPGTNRASVVEDCKRNMPWRNNVQAAALAAYSGPLIDGALYLEVTFFMPRPKSHFRTGKNAHILRDSAPKYPTTKPDRTKLLRALEDALTGVLWHDDTQIVGGPVWRLYVNGDGRPGAQVIVARMEGKP